MTRYVRVRRPWWTPWPVATPRQWMVALVITGLLLVLGNVQGEKHWGLAALGVAMVLVPSGLWLWETLDARARARR